MSISSQVHGALRAGEGQARHIASRIRRVSGESYTTAQVGRALQSLKKRGKARYDVCRWRTNEE